MKLLCINYPTSVDITLSRKVEPVIVEVDEKNIRESIKKLLFVSNYNYVLTAVNGHLYVLEATDLKKKVYSQRQISYHPYAHLVLI